MKTVILCGGTGTRLAGETEFKPKPLVEIGGKPILWHIMKIYESQGFNDFILCLGYKGNMIKNYILNLKEMSNDFQTDLKTGETIIYNSNGGDGCLESKVICADTGLNSMTGSRIAKIKKYIGDDEDFFLTYGDGVGNVNLNELYDAHKDCKAIVTITAVRHLSKFGLLDVGSNVHNKLSIVNSFNEKPAGDDWINGGYIVCSKKIFDYLTENEKCILEQETLMRLASEKKLYMYHHEDYWQCMDTQKEVDLLNKEYKKGAPWFNIKK